MPPIILTLKLDQTSFETLDILRQQYFPRARNFLSAHVTLFHALPGEQELSIRETLQNLCKETPVFPLSFPKLSFLGRGVAVEIQSAELLQLRKTLAANWDASLTVQDKQGFRPHITIQNKVAPDDARRVFDRLAFAWKMADGLGEGLQLWHYLEGPWELIGEFPFVGLDSIAAL
jgi:2'-5' RNA ligase